MASATRSEVVEVAGREVTVSNPTKVYFPSAGYTEARSSSATTSRSATGALRGIRARPIVLKRYVDGADRAGVLPEARADEPPAVDRDDDAALSVRPHGRGGRRPTTRGSSLWIVNLGCIDLHPHPVRVDDLEHPDELRVDLDPYPGVAWDDVRRSALSCRRRARRARPRRGWPKTSGSRGMHLSVRIAPRWGFDDVRRAALALAREVERRAPASRPARGGRRSATASSSTTTRTPRTARRASAYSVRPTPDARVSTPLRWDEVPDCDPAAFTLATVPARFAAIGDPQRRHRRRRRVRSTRCSHSRRRQAEDGLGDRAVAAALREGRGRAAAGRAEPAGGRTARRRKRAQRRSPRRAAPPRRVRQRAPKRPRRGRSPRAQRRRPRSSRSPAPSAARTRARRPRALEGRATLRSPTRLGPSDLLVDTMRGRSSTWTRVRINLRAVPRRGAPARGAA